MWKRLISVHDQPLQFELKGRRLMLFTKKSLSILKLSLDNTEINVINLQRKCI